MSTLYSEILKVCGGQLSFSMALHAHALYHHHLLQLHNSMDSIQPGDIPDTMFALRTMAKFLGFIEFLPFKNPSPHSSVTSRDKVYYGMVYVYLKIVAL